VFGWAIAFLIITIIAGIFGFAGSVGAATWIARLLFVLGLLAFLGLLAAARRPPNV
jgi:uncharacterized membrane protein YtjA (UPF0391 family)